MTVLSIRTTDLWRWKQLLNQLSHNQCHGPCNLGNLINSDTQSKVNRLFWEHWSSGEGSGLRSRGCEFESRLRLFLSKIYTVSKERK